MSPTQQQLDDWARRLEEAARRHAAPLACEVRHGRVVAYCYDHAGANLLPELLADAGVPAAAVHVLPVGAWLLPYPAGDARNEKILAERTRPRTGEEGSREDA